MNDKQLKAFIAIADARSINRAAQEQFVSQQAMAKQLQALEDELGYPLFLRTRQGVQLTRAGEAFYGDAEQILGLMRRALERGIEGLPRETLRISCRADAGTMILLCICEAFSKLHPEVEQQFVPFPLVQQFQKLRAGAFDVTESPDSDGVRSDGLSFVKVMESPNYCVMRRLHPLAGKGRIRFSDLNGYTVSIINRGNCNGADRLRAKIQGEYPGIRLKDMQYNASQKLISTMEDVVVIMPKAFAQHNITPALQVMLPLDTNIKIPIGLVFAEKNPSPALKKFIDTARLVEFD